MPALGRLSASSKPVRSTSLIDMYMYMYQILRDGLANAGNFAKASFTKPDNFPLHLTWIATVGLAAFAYYAWQESQRGTRAMESQIGAISFKRKCLSARG